MIVNVNLLIKSFLMYISIFYDMATDKTCDYIYYVGDVTTSVKLTTEEEMCNCNFETSM